MSSSPPTESSPTGWSARSPAELLRDYLKVARRRWVVLVSITLLVAGIAVAVSLSSTKEYDATAKLLLHNDQPINDLLGLSSPSTNDPERETNTELGLIKLETVAQRVRTDLHLGTPVKDLLDKVKAEIVGNSNLVSLTVRDPDPRRAATLANAFANEYVEFRKESARANFEEAAKRLALLSPDSRSEGNSQLDTRLRELQIASSLQTGGAEVVRVASPPTSPAVPRPVLSGAVGLIVGLLLAVVVVMLLEFADRRINDEDEAQAVFGLPLLAQIPRPSRGGRSVSVTGDLLQDEGYANLAASLLFSRNEPLPRSLLVTSPSAGDGKTTVTFGLARALTLLGKSAIIVEADLRHARAGRSPEFGQGGGLTAVLMGRSEIPDELVEVDAISMRPNRGSNEGAAVSFSVLPAGLLAPQLLLSPSMAPVIEECRSLADFVLIDTPPIGLVHDAIMLVDFVDAALLVSRLRWTTKDAARRALRVLGPLEIGVLGFVVMGSSRPDGYGYGGSRYEPDQAVAEALQSGDGR
jgi:capsular polysaccharide biosynthesis protein/Mrp family chromosome partitioning ATPase